MPTLEDAQKSAFVKLVLIGDSGTGKTGAVAPLVKAGYKVRVWDYDNKIAGGILPMIVKRDCPDKLRNVEYVALRDEYSTAPVTGQGYTGVPKAWPDGLALLEKWTDGSKPKEWGQDTIAVFDSLTFIGEAAFNWISGMNPSVKDPRQWFFNAQKQVDKMLAIISSVHFKCHVIVISHVDWVNRPDGTMKGYPSSIGSALNPYIPTYFENMALCETNSGKRYIRTVPTALVDLKSPAAAFNLASQLPIETGLVDFFKTLRS
jgi:hypothetical protein